MSKEESIEIKKETLWKGATFVLGVLLIVSIFTGGFGYGGTSDVSSDSQPQAPQQPQGPQVVEPQVATVSADDDATMGKDSAKVTMIEFSDFQCPYCGRFFRDTMGKIKKDYIDTGKVKVVFRDFPLGFHENAQKAAEAGECAKEQGKFWELHDKIFENQAQLSLDNLKKWAKDIGLKTSQFDKCLDDGKYKDEVQKDMSDGQKAGVQGTPAFFINGKLISGAMPYEQVFKPVFDAELAGKKWALVFEPSGGVSVKVM